MRLKYFLWVYLIMIIMTTGLVLADYEDCFVADTMAKAPSALGGNIKAVSTGIFWPLTLPGMIVMYDTNDNNFCIGSKKSS